MIELPDIVGQSGAMERIQTAIQSKRRPHAFMFVGATGVGRRTTAMALAKALLCEDPQTDLAGQLRACDVCESCRLFNAGSHPDFHLVYKELAKYHEETSVRNRKMQELGIPVIRQFFIDVAGRRSARNRGKVFVIREAELMSREAQNAALKTLEEPPEGVTIILLARQAELMLPTTLSRCSIIRFGMLPAQFVIDTLLERDVEEPQARFWAAYTEGSIGEAIRLCEQGYYELKTEIVQRIAQLGPGGDVSLGEYLGKQTDKLANDAVTAAKKEDGSDLAKTLATRRAAAIMLRLISSVYRDAMRLGTAAQTPLIHADQPDEIRTIATRFDPERCAGILEELAEYERLLWSNVNPSTVWENAAITCAGGAGLEL